MTSTPQDTGNWKEEWNKACYKESQTMKGLTGIDRIGVSACFERMGEDFIETLLQVEREKSFKEGYKQGSHDYSGEEQEFNG